MMIEESNEFYTYVITLPYEKILSDFKRIGEIEDIKSLGIVIENDTDVSLAVRITGKEQKWSIYREISRRESDYKVPLSILGDNLLIIDVKHCGDIPTEGELRIVLVCKEKPVISCEHDGDTLAIHKEDK